MIHLQLFGTAACHLCEQAEAVINPVILDNTDTTIERVDIAEFAEFAEWQTQYATRIPVLYHPESKTEIGWPFDRVGVKAFIEALRHD